MPQKHSPNPDIIRNMFSKVAANYDKGNNVLSMGIHHLWRKKLVKMSGAHSGQSVLDCATGTGDLAIEFKKAVGPTGQVIGTDFCAEMLIPAPGKAAAKGLNIRFEQADVTRLQYPDNTFDICSISFGIRNVGDPLKGLKEMARVTKPGGQVMILEFGQVQAPVFGALYNFYSEKILPKLGGLVTGQGEAYEYLQKSSAAFP
ncbi:MAG: bifunctional demethylmenaquinone methyltransferase/2-methoxy-6-polyprenyl-1,4-benzoquinol methylase UbiE, partial [Pseudobdellovibrionaceae bacterium]